MVPALRPPLGSQANRKSPLSMVEKNVFNIFPTFNKARRALEYYHLDLQRLGDGLRPLPGLYDLPARPKEAVMIFLLRGNFKTSSSISGAGWAMSCQAFMLNSKGAGASLRHLSAVSATAACRRFVAPLPARTERSKVSCRRGSHNNRS